MPVIVHIHCPKYHSWQYSPYRFYSPFYTSKDRL